jgi:xanthine/uracil permease
MKKQFDLVSVLMGFAAGAVLMLTLGAGDFLSTRALPVAQIIYTAGTDIYVAEAFPGAAYTSAVWTAKLIYESGDVTVVQWADGNSNADNTPGAYGDVLPNLSYK